MAAVLAPCATAGVNATLHQLRHTHATEFVDDGVSLATIRKRLGHKNLQTTLRYAEQTDATADAELRRWRRHKAARCCVRGASIHAAAAKQRSRIAAIYR